MITVKYCQTMARYNVWQNSQHAACLGDMTMAELRKKRGAFFGSIFATSNHLLWGDQIWMSRFDGGVSPENIIKDSVKLHSDLQPFLDDRKRTDERILRWTLKLKQIDLIGPMTWFSGSINAHVSKPKTECITHFFNHQTHHRGQIHAMLTSAGLTPGTTDLVFMPEVEE